MIDFSALIKDKETMILKTANKKCEITPYVSLSDIEIVGKEFKENSNINYRSLVAEIIASHSKGTFEVADVIGMDETVFDEYIDICVRNNEVLKNSFDSIQTANTNERFVRAIEEAATSHSKQVKSILSPSFSKTLAREKYFSPSLAIKKVSSPNLGKNIAERTPPTSALKSMPAEMSATSLVKRMTEEPPNVVSTLNRMAEEMSATSLVKRMTEEPSNVVSTLNRMAEEMSATSLVKRMTEKMSLETIVSINRLSEISKRIEQVLKSTSILSISDEDKEKLILSYEAWGRLGWTPPPRAKLNIFATEPSDSKDAHQQLTPYLNQESLNDLFAKLRTMKHVRKSDIEEAISSFEMRNYKACALIIFSMIDARLIRSQPKENLEKNRWRSVGKKAAEAIFIDIKDKHINEQMLLTLLTHRNIITALKTVFERGNDFKIQPKVINRHFVAHGMLHRNVLRKDCVMLFLLLYNFTDFINSF